MLVHVTCNAQVWWGESCHQPQRAESDQTPTYVEVVDQSSNKEESVFRSTKSLCSLSLLFCTVSWAFSFDV